MSESKRSYIYIYIYIYITSLALRYLITLILLTPVEFCILLFYCIYVKVK